MLNIGNILILNIYVFFNYINEKVLKIVIMAHLKITEITKLLVKL